MSYATILQKRSSLELGRLLTVAKKRKLRWFGHVTRAKGTLETSSCRAQWKATENVGDLRGSGWTMLKIHRTKDRRLDPPRGGKNNVVPHSQ
jgi:hypothetical protein